MWLLLSWSKLALLAATFAVLKVTPRVVGSDPDAGLSDRMREGGLNLLDSVRENERFALLAYLVELAGAEGLFENSKKNRTLLAPVNEAFLDVRTKIVVHFLTDEGWDLHILYFLKHHLFRNQPFDANGIAAASGGSIVLETFTDELIEFEISDGPIVVDGGPTLLPDLVTASNGVIYPLQNVLIPRWFDSDIEDVLQSDPARFSTFLDLGHKHAEFRAAISSVSEEPYTVFAPTNEAFSDYSMPAGAWDGMGWHVVPGILTGRDLLLRPEVVSVAGQALIVEVNQDKRTLRINGSLIVESNLLANNGIVHVLDGLLTSLPKTVVPASAVPSLSPTEASEESSNPQSVPPSRDPTSTPTEASEEPSNPPSDCPSESTGAGLQDNSEAFDQCLWSKAQEESRGGFSTVSCDCQPAERNTEGFYIAVTLSCSEASSSTIRNTIVSTLCAPKYGACATSQECCSFPLRLCRGGLCRDAVHPRGGHLHQLGTQPEPETTTTTLGGAIIGRIESPTGKREKRWKHAKGRA